MNPDNHYDVLHYAWRAAYLIAGYIKKTLTMEEEEELDTWIASSRNNMQIFEDLTDEKNLSDYLRWYDEQYVERKLQETRSKLHLPVRSRIIPFWKYAAAAAVLLLIASTVIYFAVFYQKDKGVIANRPSDILPGRAYAQLKLANGQIAVLGAHTDSILNESVSVKDGTVTNISSSAIAWNELTIPRKAYYRVILPDGTKVWLNSESSIRYPSAFGDTREVTVTGETYFEVAKDAAHPFIVSVNGIHVQALGTQFNVNAYPNEQSVIATLVEGSIKVSDVSHTKVLTPSQQINSYDWNINTVDVSPVTAWVDNEFKLKRANIQSIMRMVERWYGARIIYKDEIDFHFNGIISRDVPVSKLLSLLEETGNVHFKIDGNEITVMK